MSTCDISVVIPTYNRPNQLLEAIEKILECDPHPNEVIIHIDGGDNVTEQAIQTSQFQQVTIIKSATQVGPGGGRNRAIAQAKNAIVASFDDDSYPLDQDYFARLIRLFDTFPKAAVIGAAIYHINEPIHKDKLLAQWKPTFVGCGCAYRKDVFLQTKGYVELPVAYGMEEVDLSLRLHHIEWNILISPWLRVFHNTTLEHHSNPKVTAASIANLALLSYLRYPLSFWWLGVVQCLNRIFWLIGHNRLAGIAQGILTIPHLIVQYQQVRQPVSVNSLRTYLQLHQAESPELAIEN